MSRFSYAIEIALFALLFYFGMSAIDNYREESDIKQELATLNELQQVVSDLRLSTVLTGFNATHHYDNHAQLQLVVGKIGQELKHHSSLSEHITELNHIIARYMQLSTMLKTSMKFATATDVYFNANQPQLRNTGETLLAKLAEFIVQPSSINGRRIERYIQENEPVLASINSEHKQWLMLKQHINFMLDNCSTAHALIAEMQNLPISQVIATTSHTLNKKINDLGQNLAVNLALLLTILFSIIATALGRQAVQLKEKSHLAEEAAKTKSQFLANMSHEIRTPMNGILGLTDLCLKTDLNKVQRQYLEKMRFSASSLMTIINDILDFSKLESDKLHIEHIDYDLHELLGNLRIMLAKSAYDKDLELVFELSPEVPQKLLGDPIRIGQILVNLLSNAIKFTESGHVSLAIKTKTLADHQSVLEFNISDTGIGLSESQQKQLFKRFSQADTSTSRKYGGTGLGLAISKLLTELMSGSISVESTPKQGSTFTVTLPCIPVRNEEKDAETVSGKQALLIAQDTMSSGVTRNILSQLGIETVWASSPAEAQEFVDKQSPDLVIVDSSIDAGEAPAIYDLCSSLKLWPNHVYDLAYYGEPRVFEGLADGDLIHHVFKPFIRAELASALMSDPQPHETVQGGDHAAQEVDTRACEQNRVLLVEDNKINQLIASEMIKETGVTLDLAENGQIALDMIESTSYDLVLMDIQMPVMDGVEATKRLRETYSEERLPIIALTANVLQDEVDHYRSIGVNEHLGKPYQQDELIAVIARYCRPKQA